jgi:hypothetical protein
MAVTVEEGHMLQAETVGSMATNMSKMLKATAKHLGGKIEVFVSAMKIEGRVYEIEFAMVNVVKPEKNSAQADAEPSGQQVSK